MKRFPHAAILLAAVALVAADKGEKEKGDGEKIKGDTEEGAGLTDQQFARLLTTFLGDPLGEQKNEIAKKLIVYTFNTPKAAVFLGEFQKNLENPARLML